MTRLSTAVLTALVAVGIGTTSVAAQTTTPNTTPSTVPADFGTPPSGEVPILFNDRHVYSNPDALQNNRALAALVHGNTILVPLRSMFEQMGATVSYDPATRTADVSKPGSDVKVTVGKPEVIINGESRPLDVPPQIYKGTMVVPLRVLSEGMGAYVQWVPDHRVVVVRYVAAPVPPPVPSAPPTPQPTEPPTLAPTPAPTPTPKPKPARQYEHFVVGDYIFSPQAYNEFSSGNNHEGPSFSGRAVGEFPIDKIPFMLEVNGEQYAYPHVGDFDGTIPPNAPCPVVGARGCVTTIGVGGSVYVPSFTAVDRNLDARVGVQVLAPRIYIGGSYLWTNTNYGYPQLHGVGFGIEKLPDLNHPLSLFGDYYYYPQIQGNFTDPSGAQFELEYRYAKYEAGVAYALPLARSTRFGVFVQAGWRGDYGIAKQAAPGNIHDEGPFAGIGLKF